MNKIEIANEIADKFDLSSSKVKLVISQANSVRIMSDLNLMIGNTIDMKIQKLVKDLCYNGKHQEALEVVIKYLIGGVDFKKCSKCDEVKMINEYHKGGVYCKPCTTAYNKGMRERLWEKGVEQGFLHCGKCDEDKPLEEFSKGNQNQCKTCRKNKSTR